MDFGLFGSISKLATDSVPYIFNYGAGWIGNMAYAGMGSVINWINEQLTYCSTAIFDNKFTIMFLDLVQNVGWALFLVGAVIAVLELGINYNRDGNKGNTHDLGLNLFKGLIATTLYLQVPVLLFRGCIYLANTFLTSAKITVINDLIDASQNGTEDIANFDLSGELPNIIVLCVLLYCVIKIVFGMLKRGGTLLVIVTVGTLHMFSIPRGYTDAFNGWCKQVVALCFTIFMQSILFAGTFYLMSYQPNLSWTYMGVALVAAEVPKLAQQFGIDINARTNISTAVNMASSISMIMRNMRPIHA